jgi:hypothetical protein
MRTSTGTGIDTWLDEIGGATTEPGDASKLRAIGAALTELERAHENLNDAVRLAKESGESWHAIGVILGTSRQAAHKRFSIAQPDGGADS